LIPLLVLFFISNSSLAQDPSMTSWVNDAANDTQIQLRTQYYTINGGYTLVEVSFDMSAARCSLTDQVRIYLYQNDGSGTYGTERYSVAFDPGPGTVPFAASDKTRILVFGVGGIDEPIYARAVISGEAPVDDFVLTTPDCLTRLRTSDPYDPNEDYTTASAITSGTTHEYLVVNNDEDWYPVTITSANPRLIFNVSYWNDYRTTESNLDLDLFLAGSTGSIIASSTSSATSTSSRITESIDEVLDPGIYYMVVRPKETYPSRNFYRLNWDTYASPNYQISGVIRDDQNNDIENVSLSGLPGTPVTNADGYYGLAVDHGWSGTVTPVLAGYTFEPVSRTYTDVQEVHLSDNYVATLDQFAISGRITNGTGSGEPGITLNGFPETVVTDAEGYYSGTVPYNWSGTIIPSSASLVFSPVSYVYSEVRAPVPDQDYTSSLRTYSLSGNVISSTGTPLEGVSMGGFPESVVTNASGVYTGQVEHGWSGTITPSLEGYTFSPTSQSLTNVSTSQQIPDFVGTLNSYEISGTVSVSGGAALSGVTLSGLPGNPVTDVNGDYTAQVDHGWNGTVTPALTGYTFDPVSSTYSSVSAAQVQDYTATPNTHQIDGYVRNGSGTGIAGVLMSGLPGDPVTDATGYYSGNVSYGSHITVTPTLSGYSFTPSSTDYTPVTGDETTDYTALEDLYLNVNQMLILLGAEAGSNSTVNVTSNVSWTVTCPASWITCSPESGNNDGSFTVTANAANTGLDDRNATLTVSGGGITRNIGIGQSGSGPVLEVSATAITLDAAAGSNQSILVVSNLDWTVNETADWLSVAPGSGTGDATLTLTADLANNLIDDRSTVVSLTGGGLTRNITVTQSGADPVLGVSSTSVILASAAGSNASLNITSNTDWTVSESAAWLSVAPTIGTGDGSITLTASSANDQSSDRSTTVTVSGGGLTRNIVVAQSGTDNILEVSLSQCTLGSDNGVGIVIGITSNTDWTASEPVYWLSVTPTSGTGDGTIHITTTSANQQITDRSATVTVTGGGIDRTIEVTQSGSEATLQVSAPAESLAPEAGSQLSIILLSNIAWTATADDDWLSISPSSGTGDQMLTLEALTENTLTAVRTTTLNVEGGGMTRNITVNQAGQTTGIAENDFQFPLKLYPNPAQDLVFLESAGERSQAVRVNVISQEGKLILEKPDLLLNPGEPVMIDLSPYPAGQYLLQIQQEGVQRVFRLVKYK